MGGPRKIFMPQTPFQMHHQEESFVALAYFHVAEDAEYTKVRFHWPG